MKKIVKQMMAIVFMLCVLFMQGMTASATGLPDAPEPFIVVESYQVSEERIIPGEQFTLTLNLKNYSAVSTAHDVLIDIENPSGVAPVYGTVSQKFIGDIGPGESRQVSLEYDSWNTITRETLDFSVAIVSTNNTNYVMLRIPSGADNPFNVLDLSIPERLYATEMASASLSYRVLGEENVNNVVFSVEVDGEVLGTSQVGSITAGATKTQSVSFQFFGAGEYVLDFYVTYVTEEGVEDTVLLESRVVTVEAKNLLQEQPGQMGTTQDETDDNSKILILTLGGVLILAIFVVIAVILKKKR